jgi:hypothetical protein
MLNGRLVAGDGKKTRMLDAGCSMKEMRRDLCRETRFLATKNPRLGGELVVEVRGGKLWCFAA